MGKGNFSMAMPVFIFMATYLCYHIQKVAFYYLYDDLDKYHRKFYFNFKAYHVLIFSLLIASCLNMAVTSLQKRELMTLLTASLITVFYVKIPFTSYSLRNIPYIKPVVIAVVWMLVCCATHNALPYIYWIDCFGFIFALCLAFDLKDHHEDKSKNLKTFADMPPPLNKIFPLFCALIYAVFFYNYFNQTIFCLIFMSAYTYTIYSKQSKWKFYILLDGLIILRLLLDLGN